MGEDALEKARPQDEHKAYAIAMGLLARREHSGYELQTKLSRRGFSADTVSHVVERLTKNNYLSDSRFADAYARSRAGKGFGPLKIRAELAQRRVDSSLVDQALDLHRGEWIDNGVHWVEKKFGVTVDRQTELKAYQAGMRRGFSHAQMREILRRLKNPS